MERLTRRRFLQAASVAGVVGAAGCTGSGNGGGSDGTTGDGSDGAGQTSGGETTAADGGTTTDGETTDDGSTTNEAAETTGTTAGSLPTWRSAELTDVRSGETFTVQELSKPVLLETFAVWCSKCLRQQKELRKLHEQVGDSVTSVTINIDPNEDAQRVRQHLQEHGFDWRYAISPPEVTESLASDFGQSIKVPPRAPVVLVCESGARRLPDGVKSASDLQSAIDQGC